jgi:fructose-bisphosphate aldolase, class II
MEKSKMPLTTMKDILGEAKIGKYAVGAFEFWSLDSAQAVVEAAQEQNMPVILQVGPLEAAFAGIKNLSKIATMVAEEVGIQVALHADHFECYDDICKALDAGFTSVMIDASRYDFRENVQLTKKVVAAAKSLGISVEAELGKLAGAEAKLNISEEEALQTDPDDAEKFVEETGIDALAVAIGTVHGFYKFTPRINIERLKKIAKKVTIPLVLHGGSGTPEEKVVEAIQNGITKVNICTEFIAAFGHAYSDAQRKVDFKYNIPGLFEPGKAAGKEVVSSKIKLFSCKS